jgi:hypothetical protein
MTAGTMRMKWELIQISSQKYEIFPYLNIACLHCGKLILASIFLFLQKAIDICLFFNLEKRCLISLRNS